MDGGADADVLQLSAGKHTFADNDKLKNIETIKTASAGSEVILSAQQEALTITGDAGVDIVNGGKGIADTISAGDGTDTITGGEGDGHHYGCGAGVDTFKVDKDTDTIQDLGCLGW